jgi:hypothetical protein
MGTHAQLGVRFPDGRISGCYVHYDGHTMKPRIDDYLDKNTMTNLVLLIDKAQSVGGIRSFHSPKLTAMIDDDFTAVTELLSDHQPWPIDEHSWGNGSLAESYFWLVDYDTGEVREWS